MPEKKTNPTIDIVAIFSLLRGGFTLSNILKIVALIIGGAAVPQLTEVVPAAMSSNGVDASQLVDTAVPVASALVVWFVSTFFKVKPEIVQAVIAWTANTNNDDAGQRVDNACLLILKARHGDVPEVAANLSRLAKSISDINFPDPNKKALPNV